MFTRKLRNTLVCGSALCLLLLPGGAVWGQARPSPLRDAAEIVRHQQEGQLSLLDAIKVAEKHTSGQAVRGEARLVAGGSPEGKADSMQHRLAPRKLIYAIDCFDKGKLLEVQIDAQARQVIEVKPHKVRRPTAPPAKP